MVGGILQKSRKSHWLGLSCRAVVCSLHLWDQTLLELVRLVWNAKKAWVLAFANLVVMCRSLRSSPFLPLSISSTTPTTQIRAPVRLDWMLLRNLGKRYGSFHGPACGNDVLTIPQQPYSISVSARFDKHGSLTGILFILSKHCISSGPPTDKQAQTSCDLKTQPKISAWHPKSSDKEEPPWRMERIPYMVLTTAWRLG